MLQNIHWITLSLIFVYAALPILSPILLKLDLKRYGWWIQTVYRFFCHQRAERSLFLFGEKLSYSFDELHGYGYGSTMLGYPFIGNEQLGYKIAYCTRDTFMYSLMTIVGFIISIIRREIKVKWWIIVGLILPMTIDGIIQFFSEATFLVQDKIGITLEKPFYLSNNLTRAVTGALFGIGIGLFVFSELKSAAKEE